MWSFLEIEDSDDIDNNLIDLLFSVIGDQFVLAYCSALAQLFFAFAYTSVEGKSHGPLITHILMTIIAFRSVIHESTLNNKLAAVPTLGQSNIATITTPKMLISTFIVCQEVVISMHACMYVCISVRWWLASGMHANAFHFIVCEPW